MTSGGRGPRPTSGHGSESLPVAYNETLVELGGKDPTMVVLDSELSGPSRTSPFGTRHPERSFHLGSMESTMVTMAAGLALGGRTVFASSNAVFAAGHAYDMIRQSVCYNHANVKIVGTHGGHSRGGDHDPPQMLEDIGLMRGLPRMTVVVPADAPTTRAAVRAMAAFEGPGYLRLTREPLPTVTDGSFTIGKAAELRAGTDITIVAIGALVARGLDVAEELHRIGVETRVLDLASVKPFDEKAILRAARDTGAILTMEEHTVTTGIGSMVASATSENYPVPVRRLALPDIFGDSGGPGVPADRYGLSRERALEEAWELLGLRGKVQ